MRSATRWLRNQGTAYARATVRPRRYPYGINRPISHIVTTRRTIAPRKLSRMPMRWPARNRNERRRRTRATLPRGRRQGAALRAAFGRGAQVISARSAPPARRRRGGPMGAFDSPPSLMVNPVRPVGRAAVAEPERTRLPRRDDRRLDA